MEETELKLIYGGASISGAVINALVKSISLALELGRSLGTAIRRLTTGSKC